MMSPQKFLDDLLSSRGYSTDRYTATERRYKTKPSQLQLVSYGTDILDAIRKTNVSRLSALLRSGVSPNPCNKFGECILSMSCKRSTPDLVRAQIEAGASVRVADDFGRTPLHHAAWAGTPNFDIVGMLLDKDKSMLRVKDRGGRTPLEYLIPAKWEAWTNFLIRWKEVYWPPRQGGPGPAEWDERSRLLVIEAGPGDSLPDPAGSLSLEIATLVASGKIKPDEAAAFFEGDPSLPVTSVPHPGGVNEGIMPPMHPVAMMFLTLGKAVHTKPLDMGEVGTEAESEKTQAERIEASDLSMALLKPDHQQQTPDQKDKDNTIIGAYPHRVQA